MQQILNTISNQETSEEYSVTEISNRIKSLVEANIGFVKVKGEISGFKQAGSGHAYFNLKDNNSVLACTCWKSSLARIQMKLEDGVEIVASGKISTYAGQSRYQLSVENATKGGVGNLMKLLMELKEKLTKEGIFDESKKKKLPFLPKKLGIITSISGAVIKDILHRVKDRFPVKVVIWPVTVQGETAASEVSKAIDGFNTMDEKPDVLIVARGGGSIEDLWPFNEEIVVRAAYRSSIPLISAVGHETDFTLLDFVADVRAPTPTAAAEFAVPVLSDLKNTIQNYITILAKRLQTYISYRYNVLTIYANSLNFEKFALQKQQYIDDVSIRLTEMMHLFLRLKVMKFNNYSMARIAPNKLISSLQKELLSVGKSMEKAMINFYRDKKSIIQLYNSLLENLDIQKVLKRGFAIVKQNNKAIESITNIEQNKNIDIQMKDGKIKALVSGIG